MITPVVTKDANTRLLQPQRPRTRVYNDENALPATQQQKTLHSRHKSQPVLKAGFTTAGPQKLGPRKAFGDVSNANNVIVNRSFKEERAAKDAAKAEQWQREKAALEQLLARAHAACPPIQKQQDSMALKSVVSNPAIKSTNKFSGPAPVSKPAPEIIRPQPVKAVRKSRTTVFQEKPAQQASPVVLQQDLEFPRVRPAHILKRDQYVPPAQPVVNRQPVLEPSVKLVEECEGVSLQSIEEEVSRPDAIYTYTEELSVIQEPPKPSIQPIDQESFEPAVEYLSELISKGEEPVPSVLREIDVHVPFAEELEGIPLSATTAPLPEEYWDEEEDEVYAEDGYVTARSFKSLGDNVTGNATRTLYPHVDQGVKRELAAAKLHVEASRDPEEEYEDRWDTSMVSEYNEEIFEYMRGLEQRMAPNPHYMDKQTEIQWSMRAVLMDWIVQVHHRFGLLPETLFLTVNLIDRFLSQKVVSLTKLQLVGATAIFVAAKYEEVDCPSIQEVQFMVDNGYKIEEILKAERFMLSMLGFELGFPGPMSFLRRISKADDYDLETRTLAKYFIEITIMDERFLPCVSSFIAAGAHCLARLMLRKGNWVCALSILDWLSC